MSRKLVRHLIAIGSASMLIGLMAGGCASGGEATPGTVNTGGSGAQDSGLGGFGGGVGGSGGGIGGFGGTAATAGAGGTAGAVDGGDAGGAPGDSGIDGNGGAGGVSGGGGQSGAAGSGTGGCGSIPESCNGLDDNCNGQIDEGDPGGGDACTVPNKEGVCALGTKHCINGVLTCVPDNQPSSEKCDGLDNNCDGQTDEGNPGGNAACDTGQPGICSAGTSACVGGKIVCNQNFTAAPEKCNGLDDNCDGNTDEGNPGGGVSCSVQGAKGVCAIGLTDCQQGQIKCVAQYQQSAEICDGKDNDCNGTVDDNISSVPCPDSGKKGVCKPGHTQCTGGTTQCVADIQTGSAEICNGLDDNCNGQTDEASPSTMCSTQYPNAANVATWQCNGSCGIAACSPGYLNSDGVLGNGCEATTCSDQPSPNTCSGAQTLSVPSTTGGQLRVVGETAWYKVSFSQPAPGATYNPSIKLTQGSSEYQMDVLTSCSAAVTCPQTGARSGGSGSGETGSGANIDTWSMNFSNPTSCGGALGACTNKSVVPTTLYVRIKRTSIPSSGTQPECDPFQVTVSK